jgi:heme-degrading monooxygenase HmoA
MGALRRFCDDPAREHRQDQEDFVAWMKGPDFAAGHSQHRTGGPVGTGSEVWSFDVLETEAPAAG